MEKMVEEYLSFARGESSEQVKICNLREILEEVVKKCQLDERANRFKYKWKFTNTS